MLTFFQTFFTLENIRTLEDAYSARMLLGDIYGIYVYIDTFNYCYKILYVRTVQEITVFPKVYSHDDILMKALEHAFRILEENKVEDGTD